MSTQPKNMTGFTGTSYSINHPPKSLQDTNSLMLMTANQRIPINIEDILVQEDKLWKILDNIRTNSNFNFSAEEYLEFSQITSVQDYQIFFSDIKAKSIINNAMIFEYISAMLCIFVYLEDLLTTASMEHLKNILYYAHQNLIMTFSLLSKKISKAYENNLFVMKLRSIIANRKSKNIKGKDLTLIEQNNNILYNSIGHFFLIFFNNEKHEKIFAIFNDIFCNINKCTIDNVKNNLTNLKNMIVHCADHSNSSIVHINLEGPFLPSKTADTKPYTLVLDLDETLIHCPEQQEIMPLIRPGASEFLEELSKYYEIVIFTAATKDYADKVIKFIDQNDEFISHRLYRQHTTVTNRTYLKDLSKLGRDLSKTIIVDNASDNFQMQSDNGIFISTWIDDQSDTQLYDFIPILREIAKSNSKDVRKDLRRIRDTMMRFYIKGDQQPFNTVLNFIKKESNTK
ncbi:MAG: HAD family hydrolase [archaeon]|nr:HAD family hydrolase [archaeon]